MAKLKYKGLTEEIYLSFLCSHKKQAKDFETHLRQLVEGGVMT
jgi:hypothetical protein